MLRQPEVQNAPGTSMPEHSLVGQLKDFFFEISRNWFATLVEQVPSSVTNVQVDCQDGESLICQVGVQSKKRCQIASQCIREVQCFVGKSDLYRAHSVVFYAVDSMRTASKSACALLLETSRCAPAVPVCREKNTGHSGSDKFEDMQ